MQLNLRIIAFRQALAVILLSLLFHTSLSSQVVLDTAINFTVKDTKGYTHKLFDYLEDNKLVVIDFFMVSCGPCGTYAPLISKSYQNFGCNSGNVIFLGINYGSDNQAVELFGNSNGVMYPEASGLEGNGNSVTELYYPLSFPTVLLILPDATIPEPYIWPPTTQVLDSLLEFYGGTYSPCTTSAGTCLYHDGSYAVYPNPFTDFLQVIIREPHKEIRVQIRNVLGNIILQQKLVPGSKHSVIPTADLQPGIYVLSIWEHGNPKYIGKFMKQ